VDFFSGGGVQAGSVPENPVLPQPSRERFQRPTLTPRRRVQHAVRAHDQRQTAPLGEPRGLLEIHAPESVNVNQGRR